MQATKSQELLALVQDVRQCDLCTKLAPTSSKEPRPRALRNILAGAPTEFARGLGYWSDELDNLDAEVMLVAQDPGSEAYFRKAGPSQGQSGAIPWNDPLHPEKDFSWHNMLGHLAANGLDVRRCFATNAVLCARTTDGSSGPAFPVWFRNCRPFLRRQIELVSPKVIAPLGELATESVFEALGHKMPAMPFRDLVSGPPIPVGHRGQWIVPLFHPATRAVDRTDAAQKADYARIVVALGSGT